MVFLVIEEFMRGELPSCGGEWPIMRAIMASMLRCAIKATEKVPILQSGRSRVLQKLEGSFRHFLLSNKRPRHLFVRHRSNNFEEVWFGRAFPHDSILHFLLASSTSLITRLSHKILLVIAKSLTNNFVESKESKRETEITDSQP